MLDIPKSFFREENRNGYLVSEMMKRSWAAQLDIFNSLKELLDKYGLRYFADFGTLLGAVRHHGYIPWDDDFDISMPRKDFMILLEHADEIEDGLVIRSVYNSNTYMNGNAVITHKVDTLRWDDERTNRYHGCPFICYLDIFPWDYVPREKHDFEVQTELYELSYKLMYELQRIENSLNYGRLLTFNELSSSTFSKEGRVCKFLNEFERLRELLADEISDVCFDSDTKLRQQLCIATDRIAQMCDEKDADYVEYYPNFCTGQAFKPERKKEWQADMVQLPFEFEFIMAPKEYIVILEHQYGKDYMQPVQFAADHNYPFFRNEIRVLMNGDTGEMLTDSPIKEPSVENIPVEIRDYLVTEDGALKKIIIYGLSGTDVINRGKEGLNSIISFLENKKSENTVLFVFSPPGLKNFMAKCNLEMCKDYSEMLEKIGGMENVILDENPTTEMLWALIFICDEYYGDDCRLAEIYKKWSANG